MISMIKRLVALLLILILPAGTALAGEQHLRFVLSVGPAENRTEAAADLVFRDDETLILSDLFPSYVLSLPASGGMKLRLPSFSADDFEILPDNFGTIFPIVRAGCQMAGSDGSVRVGLIRPEQRIFPAVKILTEKIELRSRDRLPFLRNSQNVRTREGDAACRSGACKQGRDEKENGQNGNDFFHGCCPFIFLLTPRISEKSPVI